LSPRAKASKPPKPDPIEVWYVGAGGAKPKVVEFLSNVGAASVWEASFFRSEEECQAYLDEHLANGSTGRHPGRVDKDGRVWKDDEIIPPAHWAIASEMIQL
jgi:hypothetical protein